MDDPILPNPGGQLDPSEVVGRDRLIDYLWRVLDRQSVVLTAERRVGKTSIVRKMAAHSPGGALVFYRDLEGQRKRLEFVDSVYRSVEDYLTTLRKTATRVRAFLSLLRGAEVAGVVRFPDGEAQHWKSLLVNTVDDLAEHHPGLIIFFWDELPLMIYDVAKSEGEAAAMELLDILRSIRQTHRNVRMVFTGSVGLHAVLSSLKRAGYANEATNDMLVVDVLPLTDDDAETLARRLLDGARVQAGDPIDSARRIAASVDGIPFLIHHVVSRLSLNGQDATPESITRVVTDLLVDPQDPLDFGHYRTRIDVYYLREEVPIALVS